MSGHNINPIGPPPTGKGGAEIVEAGRLAYLQTLSPGGPPLLGAWYTRINNKSDKKMQQSRGREGPEIA